MSWLSSLFGGGGEDPRAVEQRMQAQREIDARNAAAAQERQMQMQLDYLNQLRADQAAKDAAEAAKDPTATRQAATTAVNAAFAPNYATTALPDVTTDPYEQEVYDRQYKDVQDYLDRMFNRGVISESGRAAALRDVDVNQAPKARQQLQDLSNTILSAERSKLGSFENQARERAGNLNVGEAFDVTPYSTGLQTELGSFSKGLPDLFKSQVPTSLFDTSNLSNIAGSVQGAGNRPFEPDITPVSGAGSTEDTDPLTGQKLVQKRTSTVF